MYLFLFIKLIGIFKQKARSITLKTKTAGFYGPVKGANTTAGSKDTYQPVHVRVFLFRLSKQWNNMPKE